MIWWWRVCRAAWTRWDQWLERRNTVDAETATWLDSLSTPEDLAEIGITDPVTKPGRRYQGRHRAMPDEPVRRPS